MINTLAHQYIDALQNIVRLQGRYGRTLLQGLPVHQEGIQAVLQDAARSYAQFAFDNARHPLRLAGIEKRYLGKQLTLCKRSLQKLTGKPVDPVAEPQKGDRRFEHNLWSESTLFDFIKQSYLLMSEVLEEGLNNLEGEDEKTRRRIEFYTRQTINALSPSNFLFTNPELLKLTWDSKGRNLAKGIERFVTDMEQSASVLKVRMTPEDAFEVGRNVAVTPGSVVYRNALVELIQYHPTTSKVAKEPLLIVPPFVNKYYILDLNEKKSMVRWLVEQGHTVFLISWVNPDLDQRNVHFNDYVVGGVIEAARQVAKITGEKRIQAAGYCIGGTALGAAMARMAASPEEDVEILSGSFFTTLLDFDNAGDINVFIDEQVVESICKQNDHNGFFDGRLLAVSFSILRENSLYWNYFVQNYLKGEDPEAFDLLYWNSDSTNIPAETHNFMLRSLYLDNDLIKPGALTIEDVPIDLSKIEAPCYFISTQQDHIAYWQTCFRGAQHLGCDATFVLGESGHIAGIVNPPEKSRYGHYISSAQKAIREETPESWFESAERQEGSWWLHWQQWLNGQSEGQVVARKVGKGLCPAPGTFVLRKSE